ncbi:MAG: flavodoxin family protein [Mahellales bacterium]
MYILGLNGSPHEDGQSFYILNMMLQYMKEQGVHVEMVNVPQVLDTARHPFCKVCSNPCNGACYKGTQLEQVFDKMAAADGIIAASPVYFGSVSGQLKAFWDKTRKLRTEKALINTVGAVVTNGGAKYGGQETTIKAIHDMMLVQGMILVGDGYREADAGHQGVCGQRPAKEDEFAKKRAQIMAKRILEVCQATQGIRPNK